jgi:hypothetical protein
MPTLDRRRWVRGSTSAECNSLGSPDVMISVCLWRFRKPARGINAIAERRIGSPIGAAE